MSATTLSATQEPFGTTADGEKVTRYTLSSSSGLSFSLLNYGALLTHVCFKGKDLVQGFDTLPGWEENTPYFGATVGRFANRIAAGRFSLDGQDYQLALNNEPHGIACALHGGQRGFNKRLWTAAAPEIDQKMASLTLTYHSPDGEEGYPGAVDISVTYSLTVDNEIRWEVSATSTAATPINICNHSYWNLAGHASGSVLNHTLQVPATHYLPTDLGMIPTGEKAPVRHTPLDFTTPKPLGTDIQDPFLKSANGYDHCFLLPHDGDLHPAALLTDPSSELSLQLLTDAPGLQVYTANFLDGTISGKGNTAYEARTAICLETQSLPDTPNQPAFPNCILRPGETYRHRMHLLLRSTS